MRRLACYAVVLVMYLGALWQWWPIHNVDPPPQLGPYPTAPPSGAKLLTIGGK